MNASPSGGARPFYGWVVVGAAFWVLFVVFGVAYSFSSFFASFQDEFRASRADVSLVFSLSGFLYFMLGALSGRLADRVGPRWVALAGMGFLALGLYLASYASALWQLYATYSLGVGLGVGFAYVPSVGSVQPWFFRRRGLASGLAVSGIGLGTLAVPLASVWLLSAMDWRASFRVLALASLVLGGLAAWLLDNRPARRGFLPDNAPGDPRAAGAPAGKAAGMGTGEALRTRTFWLLYAGMFACSIGLFIPFVHLVPYALDHGHAQATGALLIGLIGVGSAVGRFGLAGIADRYPRNAISALLYGAMGVMFALWLGAGGVLALAVFALLFGTFYGAFVALAPALTMDYFGARNVSGIIGALYTAAGFGNLLGPLLAGLAYDLQQSYALPIGAGAVAMLLACACSLALPRSR